jgi:hypothetical protein
VQDLTCDEVNDSAAGFALDILDPAARASVAAHLIRCPDCRDTVSGLQDSAAQLLDMGAAPAPEHTWSAGERPESDWADDPWDESDWTVRRVVRPARRRLRLVVTVAAAALFLVGTTFGPEIEQSSNTVGPAIASAPLVSAGSTVGSVRFYAGRAPAVEIEIDGLAVSGRLACELLAPDGTIFPIGDLLVIAGRAGWSAPDRVSPAAASEVLLVDGAGHVVAAASLTPELVS